MIKDIDLLEQIMARHADGLGSNLATAFLAEHGQPAWAHDVLPMIDDHHRISATGAPDQLPEIFRRADWIDVSLGLITFGLDRAQVRAVRRAFPNAGFHRRLVALSAKRLLTHPLDPLPMLKR